MGNGHSGKHWGVNVGEEVSTLGGVDGMIVVEVISLVGDNGGTKSASYASGSIC
jgi:hypothetical protein